MPPQPPQPYFVSSNILNTLNSQVPIQVPVLQNIIPNLINSINSNNNNSNNSRQVYPSIEGVSSPIYDKGEGNNILLTIGISDRMIGTIMGKNGCIIKDIKNQTGVDIHVIY